MALAHFERRHAVDSFAVIVMLILTFSWGLNSVAAKISNVGFNPIATIFLRSAIGLLLIFVWCRIRGIEIFDRDGSLWPGILAGLLFAGEFTLIYIGLEYTTVARSALMVNTMPFWVLLGAHFLLGERITALKSTGLVLAFCGVMLVFSDRLSAMGPQTLLGDLLSLTAGILWALTTLVIKKSVLNTGKPEKLLIYQVGISTLATVPMLAFAGPFLRDVSALAVGSVLFQGIFVVAVSYLVWFWIMRQYPAAGLASFAFLTPAFGVICGAAILGEPLSLRIVLALVLIAAGLMIVNRPMRRAPLSGA